jgi:ribosome biogenesis GTPase
LIINKILQGRIVAGHGRHFIIENNAGERILAYPKGKRCTGVVGDYAYYEISSTSSDAVITAILPRINTLFRQDSIRQKYFASNIDQVLFFVSCFPSLNESQLSRALVACEQENISTHIIFNKIDLPNYVETKAQLEPYYKMKIPITEVSIKYADSSTLEKMHEIITDKISLIIGQSGTGKSSFLNLLIPKAQAAVSEVSTALQSGRHTTTSTTLHWVDHARKTGLVDSPGFQEFGLHQITPSELDKLMPDIKAHVGKCRFYNCTHRHEPHCGVIQAYNEGHIFKNRLEIYQSIFDEISAPKW